MEAAAPWRHEYADAQNRGTVEVMTAELAVSVFVSNLARR